MVREEGNKAGGPWDCYEAEDFFGWEAERVIAVTGGDYIMELMTRARTHLCVILVKRPSYPDIYSDVKEYFQQAADHKLVSMVELPHKLEFRRRVRAEERERAIMRCH